MVYFEGSYLNLSGTNTLGVGVVRDVEMGQGFFNKSEMD